MKYNITPAEIHKLLASLGIPVAYLKFDEPQKPPFVVWFETGADIHGADGMNMLEEKTIRIELYCSKKDPELERRTEELFSDTELSRDTDIYIESENLIESVFEFDIINKLKKG